MEVVVCMKGANNQITSTGLKCPCAASQRREDMDKQVEGQGMRLSRLIRLQINTENGHIVCNVHFFYCLTIFTWLNLQDRHL